MSLVLVAGGAGFLGSAIVRRFLASGEGVVILDAFDDGGEGRAHKEERIADSARHPRATVVRGDATDASFLESVFAEHRPSAVVNAASLRAGGAGIGPLLETTRSSGAGAFVHLSDGRLYRPAEAGTRAREEEALDADGDAELVVKAAEEEALLASGLPFVSLRVFVAGGAAGGAARFPLDALEALLTDEEIVLPDDAARDFVHTEDVARAVLLALARRPLGEMINTGSGTPVRPSEVVAALGTATGKTPRIAVSGNSARPPRIADLEKAWERLGYSPQFSASDIATDVVRARMNPGEALSSFRTDASQASAPADPPKPVSRRELFDLFRKPFAGSGGKRPGER